ncbi:FGGY family carbohydrate kinase [Pseudoruegeria sp. HB172150]|uniref:xylulokinase n=1 Tax=Pseudoruegeria sp. HB172150 TaxID=2721164 RepID=UPI001557A679
MSTADLILAADFGTSGVKIGAVGPDLVPVATTVEPYPLHLPAPSHAEQIPEDWWNALARGIARLKAEIPDLAARCGAVVFTAQLCAVICAKSDGTVLRPAMVWLDKRAAPLIRKRMGGLVTLAGYNLPFLLRSIRIANGAPSHNGMDPPGKMLWLMQHEPDVFSGADHILDVKDWLLLRATGTVTTTADSANLTWLMDTRRGREGWSPKLAHHLGLTLDKLPKIVDGTEVVGGLTREAAEGLGLRADIPVVAGGGDVTATAIGSGAVADGALHLCLSTSSWVSGFYDRRVLNIFASYATVTSAIGHRPLLIATQESAGSALAWLARMQGAGTDDAALSAYYDRIGNYAADDPFFLPWLAGERSPMDEERLRGAFYGLNLRHGPEALKRAALEGVACNIRWAYDLVAKERGTRTDGPIPAVGGAAANPQLAQALADVLNRPISVGETALAGMRGAAAIAAPTLGWAGDVWQAAGRLRDGPARNFVPDPGRVAMLQDRYAELALLRKSLAKLYKRRKGKA